MESGSVAGAAISLHPISRRDALLSIGGAALCASARTLCNAQAQITIGGLPVHLHLSALNSAILRLSLLNVPPAAALEELNTDAALDLGLQGRTLLNERAIGSSRVLPWAGRRVRLIDSPLTVAIEESNGQSIQWFRIDDDGTVTFKSSSGPVFGLGEGGPQFDRRGHQYTMRNGEFGPLLADAGARMPIPWLISADGWAIFFHRPYGVINLTGPEYVFEQPATAVENAIPLDIFFVASSEPKEILHAYVQITGFPHLPPLWALGYQQSHRTLSSRDEILGEAKKFRQDKFPCDTMIYLGTGFCPSGWNTSHGSFTFNEKVFPDPKEMIQELHDEHFHLVLHLTRPPEHLHGRVSDTAAASRDMSDAAYYWARHLDVLRLGVDGWWPDEGDPLAPEARLVRNRMYWEGPIKERPNERPFALHRNGYAGLQRYGWLWSGDVDSTWKTLQEQIAVALNTGLSGLPYWGSDTGGFVPTKELTGELYVRWFQFSTFCPLFRSHGRNWKLRLPWGWNTGEVGPIESDPRVLPDPNELHNAQVEPICRKYLGLRYSLLLYTYSAVRTAHETGLPVMRALWIEYPDDPQAVGLSNEYLWGSNLLIAPVTQPRAATKQVYLPRGIWYDFWTGERIEGGKTVDRTVDLATIPIYVRGGAVLPIGPVKQYVAEKSDEPITLRVHPGANGEFSLYADDGESFAYRHGDFMQLSLKWNDTSRELTIALAPESTKIWPGYNHFLIELPGETARQRVHFEGNPVLLQL